MLAFIYILENWQEVAVFSNNVVKQPQNFLWSDIDRYFQKKKKRERERNSTCGRYFQAVVISHGLFQVIGWDTLVLNDRQGFSMDRGMLENSIVKVALFTSLAWMIQEIV
jgi:hypothetical protein